ncbi:MAG TPA: aa3-type cytochrome c oxidase subunit IV [Caulobacteraceae bacterium]|nr:aa3-type cytochrome c oxidase subunit IV [Caulobacteraceae bacterium]
MAQSSTEYHHGDMNVTEQQASYQLFMGLTKWGSLAVAVVVLALTLWFCLGVGFFGGAIPAVVLLVLGVLFLREKPSH